MRSTKHLVKLATMGVDGGGWYNVASYQIHRYASLLEWDVQRFINVLAITSPRVHVLKNWKLATQYMRDGSTKGMLPNVAAALAHYEATGDIRGPKTEAFARALRGDTTALVLDVWMARALGVDERKVTSKKNSEAAHRRVKRAALLLGMSVRDTQAAIWTGALRAAGHTPRGYLS